MAKYQVNHTCGHEQEHTLFGKHTDRERKLDWLAGTLCTECWEKDQDVKRTEKHAKEQKKAEEYGLENKLVALSGTEKQIAWAEVIRTQYMVALDKPMQKLDKVDDQELGQFMIELYNWAANIDDAKWWIDHREPEKTANLIDVLNYTFNGNGRAPTGGELLKHLVSISPALTLNIAKKLDMEQIYLAKKEREEAKKSNPRPPRPDWYLAMIKSVGGENDWKSVKWNWKIYGGAGRYNIYLSGENFNLTDDQRDELLDYEKKVDAYEAANK